MALWLSARAPAVAHSMHSVARLSGPVSSLHVHRREKGILMEIEKNSVQRIWIRDRTRAQHAL